MIRRSASAFLIWLALTGSLAAQGWFPLAAVAPPVFSFNFAALSSIPANMSFARTGTATYYDSGGNLATAATNTARFGYDFFSLKQIGLIIEPAAVALAIRNNSWQGAVAGAPGTAPTNWTITCNGNGLSTSIANPGSVQNNIDYGDVRIFGTTSSTAECDIYYEATNFRSSSNGDSWVHSSYLTLVGGSNANIATILEDIDERNASNTFLAFRGTGTNLYSSIIPNTWLRFSDRLIVNQATIGFVSPVLRVIPSGSGVAVDITIRIGLPQLEFGSFATSVVRATGSVGTRNQDFPQLTGSAATLLTSSAYSVVASFNNALSQSGAVLGANTANYPGFGFVGGNYTVSNGAGVSQLSVAPTVPASGQQLIGLSNGGTSRFLTSNGGTLRGGATGSDSSNIAVGPFVGTGFSSGFSIAGDIQRIDLYSAPLTQAQLEAKTNPTETTAWGDSLTAGTGSVAPLVNYGYTGYLNALTQQAMNAQGVGGQTSTQIAARMLADTKHTNDNVLIEAGRNDIANQANILTQIASMVAHLSPGNTRFVVLSIINATAENSAASGANLTAYNQIISINAALAAAYPSNYIDVRSAIVSASSGANDAPAATIMYQGSVHPNDWGYQIMATQINTFGHNHAWPGY